MDSEVEWVVGSSIRPVVSSWDESECSTPNVGIVSWVVALSPSCHCLLSVSNIADHCHQEWLDGQYSVFCRLWHPRSTIHFTPWTRLNVWSRFRAPLSKSKFSCVGHRPPCSVWMLSSPYDTARYMNRTHNHFSHTRSPELQQSRGRGAHATYVVSACVSAIPWVLPSECTFVGHKHPKQSSVYYFCIYKYLWELIVPRKYEKKFISYFEDSKNILV